MYLAAVIEILQSIRQSDMSPILSRIYKAQGGTESLDLLMKYMYVAAFIGALLALTASPYVSRQSSRCPFHDCTTLHDTPS